MRVLVRVLVMVLMRVLMMVARGGGGSGEVKGAGDWRRGVEGV